MNNSRNDDLGNRANMTDGPRPEDLGYPLDIDTHLSDEDASTILHTQHGGQVQFFIDALQMKQPVSPDVAASLLESVMKSTIPGDATQLVVKMRLCQWEQYLTPPESLEEIAHRAAVFLDSEEGVELSNFYAMTIARTTD